MPNFLDIAVLEVSCRFCLADLIFPINRTLMSAYSRSCSVNFFTRRSQAKEITDKSEDEVAPPHSSFHSLTVFLAKCSKQDMN